jgi:MFS family permease
MAGARDVLAYAAVRRYLASTALAALGLNIIVTVLFKQVFDVSGDTLDIGLVGLAQFIPAVLLVLVSGWVADRFDRRRVTAVFLLARAVCAVGFVIYSRLEPGSLWPIFAIAFAFGAADAMIAPARRSIAPLLTPPEAFPHVVALWTAVFTASSIVGPVLGGFLYSIGPGTAYAVAALFELAAIVPILMIVYARSAGASGRRCWSWSASSAPARWCSASPGAMPLRSSRWWWCRRPT